MEKNYKFVERTKTTPAKTETYKVYTYYVCNRQTNKVETRQRHSLPSLIFQEFPTEVSCLKFQKKYAIDSVNRHKKYIKEYKQEAKRYDRQIQKARSRNRSA